jgi:hypothetical protein
VQNGFAQTQLGKCSFNGKYSRNILKSTTQIFGVG